LLGWIVRASGMHKLHQAKTLLHAKLLLDLLTRMLSVTFSPDRGLSPVFLSAVIRSLPVSSRQRQRRLSVLGTIPQRNGNTRD